MITAVQNQDIYIIRFPYNKEIIDIVKNVPGRMWDANNKYWTIPVDRLGFLIQQLHNTPYEHSLQIYSAEQIGENATLDSTSSIPNIDIKDVELYVEDGAHLFQHQIDFMKYAIDRYNRGLYSGFILGDQQGLGKTLEATNLALYNKKYRGLKHCLIISCVNSAKYNWLEDIKKHTNGKYVPYLLGSRKRKNGNIIVGGSADKLKDLMCGHMYGKKEEPALPFFLIINIEAFHMRQNRRYPITERLTTLLNKNYIGMIILDEIHRGCSPTSRQGKQLLKLKKDTMSSKVMWLPMTGTPIINKPTDVFLPLKLVDGHTTNSYRTWCEHYCVYGGFGGYNIIAYKNIPQLKQMLQANMLRRLKSEVLDLPDKLHTIEYVENTPYQAKLYKDIVMDTLSHRDEILSALNPMVKLLKLRQVNGSPELIDKDLVIDNSYLEKNSKMSRLLDLVNMIISNNEKVVIFSNWVESLRTVYRFLAAHYKVCCYTGTMSSEDRESHKKKFIEDPEYKIMIGTVGALGVSHTLTVANNVIFYDLPWNPATMEQAEDRCHRAGTTSTVNVYSIITKDTVDEKVYNLIMHKDGISKYIVDNQLSFRDHPELLDMLLSDRNQLGGTNQ